MNNLTISCQIYDVCISQRHCAIISIQSPINCLIVSLYPMNPIQKVKDTEIFFLKRKNLVKALPKFLKHENGWLRSKECTTSPLHESGFKILLHPPYPDETTKDFFCCRQILKEVSLKKKNILIEPKGFVAFKDNYVLTI